MLKRYYVKAWLTLAARQDDLPPTVIVGIIANSLQEAQARVCMQGAALGYLTFDTVEAVEEWSEAISLSDLLTLDIVKQVACF